MGIIRRPLVLIVAAVMGGLGAGGAVALPAAACPQVPFYGVVGSSTYIPFKNLPTFKNGPGGTMSVTKDFSRSASYQVTAGAESEVGAVLAKAKVSISASLTKTNSSTVTNNYTHKITRGKYGHAQYVAWGKKVTWTKYLYTSSCRQQVLGRGVIKFPASAEGWRYWETSH